MLSSTIIKFTKHARERWDERIGLNGYEGLIHSVVASVAPSKDQRKAVFLWYHRGKRYSADHYSETVNSIFVNEKDDAAFMCRFVAKGKLVVISVAKLSVCVQFRKDNPSPKNLKKKAKKKKRKEFLLLENLKEKLLGKEGLVTYLRPTMDTVDLQNRRNYKVVGLPDAEKKGFIRIRDDSDEDYLYPSDWFSPPFLESGLQTEKSVV